MLRDIIYPPSLRYKSKNEFDPYLFFLEHFYHGKFLRFHLGFFSTDAFKTISSGFAHFIKNGGQIELIINHFLTKKDKKLLSQEVKIDLFNDLEEVDIIKLLFDNLDAEGSHFERCMSYLIQKEKIKIKIIKPKLGNGYEHTKEGVFSDGENEVYFSGSTNFTRAGLINNSENINADPHWLGAERQIKINEFINQFDDIWSGNNKNYDYLSPSETEEISSGIKLKYPEIEIDELLKESSTLNNEFSESSRVKKFQKKLYHEIKGNLGLPRFPFPEGPRDYQKEAYECWVKNNRKGLFAMATGTGKTITALNCVLNAYNEQGTYNAIILVPSKALLEQWVDEVKSFNFNNILIVGGGHTGIKEIPNLVSNFEAGLKTDLIIISTYATFSSDKFQKYFNKIQDYFILIADEAHNMGAKQIKVSMSTLTITKRIGLTATPKRKYDPEGTDSICDFFNDKPPFCYSFSMERAMKEGRLTNYYYYPRIVNLDEDEKEEYVEISKKLLQFFDFENGKFKDSPFVERLLLKRKTIIHQARRKLPAFKEILKDIEAKGKLKYVFAYVPVGKSKEETDDQSLANKFVYQYIKAAHEFKPDLKLSSYTSDTVDRAAKIRSFTEGRTDILLAMKMLDEGVDIPRTEVGIFASSTGNPREYIQRRGRLLRNHVDKKFAYVYDMIVAPIASHDNKNLFRIEKNMVKNELIRVAYFASLSMNFFDSKDILEDICSRYDLDLDVIINDLKND